MKEDLLDNLLVNKKLICKQSTYSEYDYYGLTDEISSISDYLDLFEALRCALPGDVVRLYINSVGGSVAVGSMIITHIQEAMARGVYVIANIGMDTASMASAIALSCSALEVNAYSQMLVHSWKSGSFGNSNDILKEATFQHRESEKYLRSYYTNFLTEEEIVDLLRYSTDLQFGAEEIQQRWENKIAIESSPEEANTIDLDKLIEDKVISKLDELGVKYKKKVHNE